MSETHEILSTFQRNVMLSQWMNSKQIAQDTTCWLIRCPVPDNLGQMPVLHRLGRANIFKVHQAIAVKDLWCSSPVLERGKKL